MDTFRINILLRIGVIILLAFGGFYVLTETYFWLVSLWLFAFAAITTYFLIRYIESHKRELYNFLVGISQNDFSTSFTKKDFNAMDRDLHYAYTTISQNMRQLRQESEANHHFLKMIVEHSTVAMLGYNKVDKEILLMNEAVKELFNKPFLKSIEALKTINQELYEASIELASGEKKLLKMVIGGQLQNLSLRAREIRLDDKDIKLITYQNINAELDEKELESWQKLIRVLTHEIKNSAIPISTLTEVVNQLILNEDGSIKNLNELEADDLDDIKLGLSTVEKRSKGLVHFVNSYGELARVPEPNLKQHDLAQLVESVLVLFKQSAKEKNIEIVSNVHPELVLLDAELIEQVLINLVKNAIEALSKSDEKRILVDSSKMDGRTILNITDTGSGMDTETLDNVFVPFFTTKKEGSGIGLSLSRQIMRAHKGNITVKSKLGKGTAFILHF